MDNHIKEAPFIVKKSINGKYYVCGPDLGLNYRDEPLYDESWARNGWDNEDDANVAARLCNIAYRAGIRHCKNVVREFFGIIDP